MKAKLDDEGSMRYLFDVDGIPAINAGVRSILGQISVLLAENKASEESVRETIYEQVYQTNNYGRIRLDESAGTVFQVLACRCEFTTIPSAAVVNPGPDYQSELRADVARNSQGRATKRYTQEQTAKLLNSSFAMGSEALAANDSLREYGYCIIGNLTSSTYTPGGWEIEFYPKSRTQNVFVAVSVLRTPQPVTVLASQIPLPSSLIDLVTDKALEVISWKQGDQTTLYSVTNQAIQERLRSAR